MFTSPRGLVLCILVMMVVAGNTFAATSAEGGSDGHISCQLASSLYDSVGGLLGGNLGLIFGLILVFMGLWGLIQGAKPLAVLPIIAVGSLITALPSLIESNMEGLGALLKEAGISQTTFSKPTCPGSSTPSAEDIRRANETNLGVVLPTNTQRDDRPSWQQQVDPGNYFYLDSLTN